MLKKLLANIKRKKLLSLLLITLLVVASYFIYKYTYIYVERRKYDVATVAIQKVASDLRAQGIETEFSKGCGRTQEVYGKGSLTCSAGITYKNPISSRTATDILLTFSNVMSTNKFIYVNGPLKPGSPIPLTSSSHFNLKDNPLPCNLVFSTFDSDTQTINQFDLYCGKPSKFSIF